MLMGECFSIPSARAASRMLDHPVYRQEQVQAVAGSMSCSRHWTTSRRRRSVSVSRQPSTPGKLSVEELFQAVLADDLIDGGAVHFPRLAGRIAQHVRRQALVGIEAQRLVLGKDGLGAEVLKEEFPAAVRFVGFTPRLKPAIVCWIFSQVSALTLCLSSTNWLVTVWPF